MEPAAKDLGSRFFPQEFLRRAGEADTASRATERPRRSIACQVAHGGVLTGRASEEDMEIHGVQAGMGPKPIESASATPGNPVSRTPAEICDVVEISTVARLASEIQDLPEIRADLVQRVKEEIAAGNYETPKRVEIAVERLMDELFLDLS